MTATASPDARAVVLHRCAMAAPGVPNGARRLFHPGRCRHLAAEEVAGDMYCGPHATAMRRVLERPPDAPLIERPTPDQ